MSKNMTRQQIMSGGKNHRYFTDIKGPASVGSIKIEVRPVLSVNYATGRGEEMYEHIIQEGRGA